MKFKALKFTAVALIVVFAVLSFLDCFEAREFTYHDGDPEFLIHPHYTVEADRMEKNLPVYMLISGIIQMAFLLINCFALKPISAVASFVSMFLTVMSVVVNNLEVELFNALGASAEYCEITWAGWAVIALSVVIFILQIVITVKEWRFRHAAVKENADANADLTETF